MFSDSYKQAPIAIYDSGIGGLAIARVIKAGLPEESIHYIGDTTNLPYGEKRATALRGYIAQVVNFCLHKGYKLLVMACNTATAAADGFLPSYLKTVGADMNIINVIDPVITYITENNRYNQIGLIGTTYTVTQGIYAERLRTTGITLTALATPLLVPMVEACFNGGKIDHLLLDCYLKQIGAIDALIPACTHYIFLEKALKSFFSRRYAKKIEVIDVAKLTALNVKAWLTAANLLNNTKKKRPDCFMATTLTPAFKNATKKLFGATPMEINLADATRSGDFKCMDASCK
ncbi:MAG: aspartate/glutamate racemase family protein [Candidatus Cardinium sp.]|uniref:glutamate racemase n=1 Tax=Cardinium endosymbiont of Dermatophagoides farinae TaxID=2597823 RepID=UPI00164257E0|nr:aspartate/glutamate racemase family protein [Cardinium endosymbiont of Dermatophagoides farinae]UWW96504.1 MAG: aspartate/glutamate racemase family protein [Candidatus Cardinium sp.]